MVLTREDVKAIKSADAVSVWFRAAEGEVRLCLIKKLKPVAGFEGEEGEVRRTLTDPQSAWQPYQASFAMLWTSYGAWQLLAHTVREGDCLTFSCRENSNGYLGKATIPAGKWSEEERYHHGSYDRLYKDELLVSLTRNGKVIVRELVLEDTIAPANTARAIQYQKTAQPVA
jgi:hypothetical protein